MALASAGTSLNVGTLIGRRRTFSAKAVAPVAVAAPDRQVPRPRTLLFPEMPLVRDTAITFAVEYRTDYLIRAFSVQDAVTLMAAHVATVLQSARGWAWNEARVDLTASISCGILAQSLTHNEFDVLIDLTGTEAPVFADWYSHMGWQASYIDGVSDGLATYVEAMVDRASERTGRRQKARENQRRWLGIP